jgi:multidrug resistance protein MdtO
MATLAQTVPKSSTALLWVREFLKAELAPYPGRAALVARMCVAATLVMLLTMTFQIPYGAYGAIFALTVSSESAEETAKSAKTIIIAFSFSVLYVLIGAMFFLQDPNLRLIWVLVTFFVMFYALSAMTNYTAAARFGYLLIITIPLWDRQIPTESKIEGTLWAAGAISLGSVVTVGVELVCAALERRDVILQPLADRLAATEELLNSCAGGLSIGDKTKEQITRFAMVGTSVIRSKLQRSAYLPAYREQMGAVIALVGRLVDIAANVANFSLNLPDNARARVCSLAASIRKIRFDLLSGKVPGPNEVLGEAPDSADAPLLVEMEKTVSLIPEAFASALSLGVYTPSRSSADPGVGLFRADALSNPEHLKFGLRGCFAASLCYLLYNGKDWPGISTAVTTCFLTGLSTVGASHQKQLLRISGAIVGGLVLGIGAEVIILPGLDSIAGFTLLFLAVTVTSAWIMTASPRISYFGLQVVVAFYLINLSEFAVQTSLLPARDRVLGILLGLLVMWFVFDQLWCASAAVQMRRTFVSNLRFLAQFAREPISNDLRSAIDRSYSLRETINSNFDRVRDLTAGVLLEFGPARERDLALREKIIQWQTQVRILFLTEIVLWKYRAQLSGFELPKALITQQRQFDDRFAMTLEEMADRLEAKPSQWPTLEKSVAHRERDGETCPNAAELTVSDQDSALLTLRRRIQNLTMSLSEDIRGVGHQTLQPGVSDRIV